MAHTYRARLKKEDESGFLSEIVRQDGGLRLDEEADTNQKVLAEALVSINNLIDIRAGNAEVLTALMLQHTAARCSTLHHTALRCNTLQHAATQ